MSADHRGWISSRPIAHRGLHDSADNPENSIGAFQAAIAAGYGIELDIHLTRDNRLAVFHDDNLERLTGRNQLVTEVSFEALSGLRLGATAQRIPALEEVFDLVAGRVPVLIEVKAGSPVARLGPALAAALDGYQGEFAVQSFDPRVLTWLKRNLPEVPRGQLSGSFSWGTMSGAKKVLLRTMLLNGTNRPDFLAYEIGAMPNLFVSFWRRYLDVPLLVWTVRTEEQLAMAGRYQANAIFENVRPSS